MTKCNTFAMVNPDSLFVDGISPMKSIREALGLSQIELSQVLSIHPSTISRWEKGQGEPTFTPGQFKKLVALLEVQGYSLSDLPDTLKPKGA
jgi:DNA-binding transcriptional regulator YiaG